VDAGSIPTSASIFPRHADRRVVSCSARVAKLVDARDLKSLGFGRAGSIPAPGTKSLFHPGSYQLVSTGTWLIPAESFV
jgi:hypothetical protein